MTFLDIVVLLIVAGICGAVGQTISGFSGGGLLAAIALGFIGALLGLWLARLMDLPEPFTLDLGSVQFPIIWSIVGASLFVALVGLISQRRRPLD